ncbi:MAG: CxxC-x17-CxxC domain-containing protein [Patescibacteria group bacterium]|nr:CxxC-x17-CxxC domain-containing protein [Patescibacteria group bacterium]
MNKDIATFAKTSYRNSFRRFGIKTTDRRRHMYLVGKTGMGKSTLLENMIINDIRSGKGVAVVDPHGDLVEKIIEYIPNDRINDVVYFNPADFDYPLAFNVVEKVEPHFRHLVASGLIGVFKKLWADSWGPRLEYILRNTILAILDYPDSTLLSIIRMLSDKAFRKKVIEKIQDPVVKAFWVNEFAGYADRFASEAVSPIQNKVGQFLSTSLIRNIVGQIKSTVDMREIMDDGKILILNLSKGRIGEDASQLLGAMIITKIQLAAMSRVDQAMDERRDFYLYIDEFQNFVTDSFTNILSEARKYRLNLSFAHQYIEQLGDTVKSAVFGNVGTMAVFRVGAVDAEELAPEFFPTFTQEDIVNLPKYEFYIKLMIDGVASDPFSAIGLVPLTDEEKTDNIEKVINIGRERYATKREIVEEKIARWHSPDKANKQHKPVPGPVQSKQNKPSANKNSTAKTSTSKYDNIYKYSADCSRCGVNTKLSFEPDGVRPVYCRDCLSLEKQEKKDEIEKRKRAKKEEMARLDEKSKEASKAELSLSEAINKKTIIFSGKKIKPSVAKTAVDEKEEKKTDESDLSEGQTIKF